MERSLHNKEGSKTMKKTCGNCKYYVECWGKIRDLTLNGVHNDTGCKDWTTKSEKK
jgi:MoaA/NifB/PqqE/SkfB family radical SAM enzyme